MHPTQLIHHHIDRHAPTSCWAPAVIPACCGAFSEVAVALAGIGTAVVQFPVASQQREIAARGFVAAMGAHLPAERCSGR
ncbi:hypothetical protein AB0F15_41580, partial [Amycolatopsis sp. NPDC026612]